MSFYFSKCAILEYAIKHIKSKNAVDHNNYILFRLLPLLAGFISIYVFWYVLVPIICLLYIVSFVEMKKDNYIYSKKKIVGAVLLALFVPFLINAFLSIIACDYIFFR